MSFHTVHFLQIWTVPSVKDLQPKYFTRYGQEIFFSFFFHQIWQPFVQTQNSHFTDEEKKDKWARIVAPIAAEGVVPAREASGPAPVRIVMSFQITHLLTSSPFFFFIKKRSSPPYHSMLRFFPQTPLWPTLFHLLNWASDVGISMSSRQVATTLARRQGLPHGSTVD